MSLSFCCLCLSWLWFSGCVDLQFSSRLAHFWPLHVSVFVFLFFFVPQRLCLWIRPHQAVPKLTEGLFIYSILYLCISFWIVSLPSNVSLLIFSSAISNLLYFPSQYYRFITRRLFLIFFISSRSLLNFLNMLNAFIINILISLSINSNICISHTSITIDYLLSSLWIFFFPSNTSNL